MTCARFLISVAVIGSIVVLSAVTACSVDTPQDFTCDATMQSCNFSCSDGDCTAQCNNPNMACQLSCTGSANCTCTGNNCQLNCESTGSCNCNAGICACTGSKCKK